LAWRGEIWRGEAWPGEARRDEAGKDPPGLITDREVKELNLKIGKHCPKLWQAISSKRYLLPKYRQGDYFSQEYLDALLGIFLATYHHNSYGEQPDAIIRSMYTVATMAMQEGRPIYFLERELGEALLRTTLPMDLCTDDIHWRRRQFRVMLPRELIALERNGETRSPMYLDIGRAKKAEWLKLPQELEREMRLYGIMTGAIRDLDAPLPVPLFERSGIVISCQLSSDSNGCPGENYSTIRPFEGLKLSEIKTGYDQHFDTGSVCDETDDALLARMEHLGLNILLFMSSVPLEYDPEPTGAIRKLQIVNDRVIPGLFPAKFVGQSQYRPAKTTTLHATHHTGRHLAQHWKAGHWKQQPVGPRWSQRRLQWIEPYQVHAPN
jgi:hypothetical protein